MAPQRFFGDESRVKWGQMGRGTDGLRESAVLLALRFVDGLT